MAADLLRTIVRNDDELQRIRAYISANPMRWLGSGPGEP